MVDTEMFVFFWSIDFFIGTEGGADAFLLYFRAEEAEAFLGSIDFFIGTEGGAVAFFLSTDFFRELYFGQQIFFVQQELSLGQ